MFQPVPGPSRLAIEPVPSAEAQHHRIDQSRKQFFNLYGYTFHGVCGVGESSRVYHCSHRDNSPGGGALVQTATKWVQFDVEVHNCLCNFRDVAKIELSYLTQITHEHIVKFISSVSLPDENFTEGIFCPVDLGPAILYQFEYCPTNLKRVLEIQPYDTFEQLEPLFLQIGGALAFLHSHDIAHHDICPANILIANATLITPAVIKAESQRYHYKLSDFGSACWNWNLDQAYTNLAPGTVDFFCHDKYSVYCSEVDDEDKLTYNAFASDNYALGLTLLATINTPLVYEHHARSELPTLVEIFNQRGLLAFLRDHHHFYVLLTVLCSVLFIPRRNLGKIIELYHNPDLELLYSLLVRWETKNSSSIKFTCAP